MVEVERSEEDDEVSEVVQDDIASADVESSAKEEAEEKEEPDDFEDSLLD